MHPNSQKPDIVVICGPTGIGKTSIAIELAQCFGGEIIGVDSMQIYKYMDIGSAKPTPSEQARVPHHLIDITNPDEPFDAAKFAALAHEKIRELHGRHILPFIVGGTGLYIKALVHGLFRIRAADPQILRELNEEARRHGSAALHQRLKACDPRAAEKIHPNDIFRIIRALEVFRSTETPISEYHGKHQFSDTPYNVLKIGLNMARAKLYRRINQRVDIMLAEGLLEEVKKLLNMGYPPSLKSMQSIGYRHMVDFLLHGVSWDETVRLLKRDTRRYAKRQLTWFRKDDNIRWINAGDTNQARQLIENFLQHAEQE